MLASTSLDFPAQLPGLRAARCSPARHGVVSPPGSGRLEIDLIGGRSAVTTCAARSPLQLLAPRPRGAAAWVVAASHGGGLVTGDAIALDVSIGPGAAACLGTQAETKVYRGSARQRLSARVGSGGLLALLPDPVSPFAGSSYEQVQRFELAADASLVVLDGFTAGRTARGERWAFARCCSRNEVHVDGALVLADAIRLVAGDGPPVARRLAGFELVATVLLLGPRVSTAAADILAALAAAPAHADVAVLSAASPLRDGLVLRLAARSVEAGMAAVRARLSFLAGALDGDPLLRRP